MADTGSPSTSSPTISCWAHVPLREGQWVVLLTVDTGSPSTSSPTTSCRPCVPLREGQRVVVLEVHGAPRWQDVSMQHMAMVSRFCEQRFLREVDDLVCANVDMKFHDHVGVEILSPLCHPVPQFLLGGQ